jgi:uncharacterized membrane protein
MNSDNQKAILPAHIEATVAAIKRLHSEHHEQATPSQRFAERLTATVGQTKFLGWLTIIVVGWIGFNLVIIVAGSRPFDAPPFAWLATAVSLGALYMTVLILSTQRRDDELADQKEQLFLQLAVLADQKSAKIIELLEEMRRDHPGIRDRVDDDAQSMSKPADPQAVIDAMKASQKDAGVATGMTMETSASNSK